MSGPEEDIPADASTLIRLGTIATVDLAAARCTVRIGDPDEDDAVSPPVRWLALRAGKTRRWSPPSEGEEVVLLCPDGQIGNGVALCGLFNDNFPAPADDETDVIEYEDGARIAYDPASHALTAVLPAGGTASIEAPGGITLKGDVTIDGTLHASGQIDSDADVQAAGISLKNHKHGNVQAGAAQTGTPV